MSDDDRDIDIPPAMLAEIRQRVHTEGPEGYELYYTLVRNAPPPWHVMVWIRFLYACIWAGAFNILIEAFRGSTKTTAIGQIWVSYRIGLYPSRTCLIIRSNGPAAKDHSSQIANIIKHNPGWKVCFPNVVPDEDRGWGDEGYWVKDNTVNYGEWVREMSQDPTFVAYSYSASTIVGKHPTNVLVTDDLHDEDNTTSHAEIERAKRIYAGTILYTIPEHQDIKTVNLLVGTPWAKGDVLDINKKTGEFRIMQTLVYQGTPKEYDKTKLTWPEGMSEEGIQKKRRLDTTGGVMFARFYLLDLTYLSAKIFPYQTYPADKIDVRWPFGGGVDYASVADPLKRTPDHSHFGLAYLGKLPLGGGVAYGGVLEMCGQAEGLGYVKTAQDLFRTWLGTVIEGDGKGEELFQLCAIQPGLRVWMLKTKGQGKAERLVNGLGPWLRNGMLKISDANTDFLNALRSFFDNYPNVDRHDPGWDAAESLYWAMRGMPDVFQMAALEQQDKMSAYAQAAEPERSPWVSLGSWE